MVLPVIFQNLQGYDAHLFIKQLACLPGELNCIPSTEEKYISFSKKIKVDEYKNKITGEMVPIYFEIRFIDSFKFLQTSLANLVGNLQKDDFHNTKEVFNKNVDLLTRKEFTLMIMFHLQINYQKHNFYQKRNSIQNQMMKK